MSRVLDTQRDALRAGVTDVSVARLVGGVAAVADTADLRADDMRPLLAVVVDGVLAPSA